MKLQERVKNFLTSKPKLLQAYVNTNMAALNYIVAPIGGLMRHLIEIQGLDPDFSPRQRELEVLIKAFDTVHEESYDKDYNVGWVTRRFQDIQQAYRKGYGDVIQETTVDIADTVEGESGEPLTIDSAEVNQIAPECEKREIRVFGDTEQERENNKDMVEPVVEETGTKFYSKDAVQKLVELANTLEKEKTKKKTKKEKKPGIKTSKKKLNKKTGKGTKVNRLHVAGQGAKNSLKESLKKNHARAVKITNDMIQSGLLANTDQAINEEIQQILFMSDDAVKTLEDVIVKHNAYKAFKGTF